MTQPIPVDPLPTDPSGQDDSATEPKTVVIEIADEDLRVLRRSGYRLCFAKRIQAQPFNVVWQAFEEFFSSNHLSWIHSFELFGSALFLPYATVRISTNVVRIDTGEQSVLDSDGLLEAPSTGGPADAVTMVNRFGTIRAGVSQTVTGLQGESHSLPIYVSAEPVPLEANPLVPVDEVLVWFEQDATTSMMLPDRPGQPQEMVSRSKGTVVDMSGSDVQTRLYAGQEWSTP